MCRTKLEFRSLTKLTLVSQGLDAALFLLVTSPEKQVPLGKQAMRLWCCGGCFLSNLFLLRSKGKKGVRLPRRQPARQSVQCPSRRLPEQRQPALPSPAPSASFAACAAAGPGRQGPARGPLGVCAPWDTQLVCLPHLAQTHCPT